MLDKGYIKDLLAKQEYNKINEYLFNVYDKILEEFIIKNSSICEKMSLLSKINYIEVHYPEYANLMKVLESIVFDENQTLIDALNTKIDFYSILKRKIKV